MSKVYARQPRPGDPIEVVMYGDGPVNHCRFLTDVEAIHLVADITAFLRANVQAKAKLDSDLHSQGGRGEVPAARLPDTGLRAISRDLVGSSGEGTQA